MTRCQCIKSDGVQCSRDAATNKPDKRFCWQHQKCKKIVGKSKSSPAIKLTEPTDFEISWIVGKPQPEKYMGFADIHKMTRDDLNRFIFTGDGEVTIVNPVGDDAEGITGQNFSIKVKSEKGGITIRRLFDAMNKKYRDVKPSIEEEFGDYWTGDHVYYEGLYERKGEKNAYGVMYGS
jgi:hypothetical protein